MSVAAPTQITVRADGALRYVTLNRPAARNALSGLLIAEFLRALDQAESERARAIVLDGAGAHFCAGGDVREMRAARQADEPEAAVARVSAAIGELCRRCAATPMALIAVVDGGALGGGLGLACAADLTIATPRAFFALPETGLGLIPAQIAPLLLARLGLSEARRLCVFGERIDAAEAWRIGLVHQISDEPHDAAALAARQALRCGPAALAATKRMLREMAAEPAKFDVGRAAALFAAAATSDEGEQGMRAFIEKALPPWSPGSDDEP